MSRDMKKLLACGCSYTKHVTTYNEKRKDFDTRTILTKNNKGSNVPTYWPEYLANDLGLEWYNSGEPGSGNDRIFNNAIKRITELDDIEVLCVLWTQMFRMNLWNYTKEMETINTFSHGLAVFSKEDPVIYETAELYLEKLKGRGSEFWINKYMYNYFTNISVLMSLCKKLGIKIIMGQAMMFEPDAGGDWSNQINTDFFDKRFGELITDIDFDPKHFIGWPIKQHLGGTALQDYGTELHEQENVVGKNDWHPNDKGHRIIANEFLKKYKEIYY